MSITFRCENTQYETKTVVEDDGETWTDYVPVEPYVEINMANSNAMDLLKLVDPGNVDYCGEWKTDRLANIRARVLFLLNAKPGEYVMPGVREGNFIYVGRSMDYVTRRLMDMLHLLAVAQRQQEAVIWY